MSCSFLSSILEIVTISTGTFVLLCLLEAIIKSIIERFTKSRRRDPDTAGHKSNSPRISHGTLPTSAHIPVITTVTTMPRHAVSDIDRHINYQIRPCQELQDLEAALSNNSTRWVSGAPPHRGFGFGPRTSVCDLPCCSLFLWLLAYLFSSFGFLQNSTSIRPYMFRHLACS